MDSPAKMPADQKTNRSFSIRHASEINLRRRAAHRKGRQQGRVDQFSF
jgi:hypothetical protein